MTPRKDQIRPPKRARSIILALLAPVAAACVHEPEQLAMSPVSLASPIGTPPSPNPKPSATASQVAVAGLPNELEIQPDREPETIIGLDETDMRERFGEPQWIQEEPPGVRWQYGTASCTVDVFFFMEVQTQELRVLSYDVTGQVDAQQSEQQCLVDLAGKADVQRS
ncbi:MAG TPA: hypothetical protein VFO41_02950 [Alphaproteobacteria bacterium]|nr:hypothetical protein [Alphaproteobacteria bacterium]